MDNLFKSWKTTLIGLVGIAGLGYNAYLNGGFNIHDFLILIFGVGFLLSKDADKTHSDDNIYVVSGSGGSHPDPKKEEK